MVPMLVVAVVLVGFFALLALVFHVLVSRGSELVVHALPYFPGFAVKRQWGGRVLEGHIGETRVRVSWRRGSEGGNRYQSGDPFVGASYHVYHRGQVHILVSPSEQRAALGGPTTVPIGPALDTRLAVKSFDAAAARRLFSDAAACELISQYVGDTKIWWESKRGILRAERRWYNVPDDIVPHVPVLRHDLSFLVAVAQRLTALDESGRSFAAPS